MRDDVSQAAHPEVRALALSDMVCLVCGSDTIDFAALRAVPGTSCMPSAHFRTLCVVLSFTKRQHEGQISHPFVQRNLSFFSIPNRLYTITR